MCDGVRSEVCDGTRSEVYDGVRSAVCDCVRSEISDLCDSFQDGDLCGCQWVPHVFDK